MGSYVGRNDVNIIEGRFIGGPLDGTWRAIALRAGVNQLEIPQLMTTYPDGILGAYSEFREGEKPKFITHVYYLAQELGGGYIFTYQGIKW